MVYLRLCWGRRGSYKEGKRVGVNSYFVMEGFSYAQARTFTAIRCCRDNGRGRVENVVVGRKKERNLP